MTARIQAQPPSASGELIPLRYVVAVLVVLAVLSVLPLGGPLVLAIWTATLLEPLTKRWTRRSEKRKRTAIVLTTLVTVVLLVPVVVTSVALAAAVADLMAKLRETKETSDLTRLLVPAELGPSLEHMSPQRIFDFARRHGGGAAQAMKTAFGAVTAAAIGIVVYVFGVYECIAHGSRARDWLRERSLVSRASFTRFADAFVETGHGLVIGIGGTALLQAVVATIGYALVGVPLPLLLGFATLFAALIPTIGTALVWLPVTILLFATGRTSAGVVLGIFGCFTSVVDNFVRPWLSRHGALRLPTFVTFVAMLGGIAVFGAFGLVLGPLFVRLSAESLDIWREQRASRPA